MIKAVYLFLVTLVCKKVEMGWANQINVDAYNISSHSCKYDLTRKCLHQFLGGAHVIKDNRQERGRAFSSLARSFSLACKNDQHKDRETNVHIAVCP